MRVVRLLQGGLLACASALLAGCSANIEDFAGKEPRLQLEEYFSGAIVAHGMVQNRSGEVTRRFRAELVGTWDGNEGELAEVFYWDDGEEEDRTWYLTKVGENRYDGQASDVVGVAEGTTAGNALNWVYQLTVDLDGRELDITMDDWMYLLDEDRLMNRTEMRKFGFRVGEIIIYMERLEETPEEAGFAERLWR